jgi:hypothetical protein
MNKTPFYKSGLDFALPGLKAKPITGSSGVQDNGGGGGGESWIAGQVDLQLSNVAAAEEQIARTDGKDNTRLQERIDKATKQGKEDKVARLQGKQDRQDVRQKSRAKRETQRNVEREEVTQERQDRKTQRFESRRSGADGIYGNEDDTAPVSNVGMLLDKIGGLFRKDDSPVPMKMSAKQYTQGQRNSKIAKDI